MWRMKIYLPVIFIGVAALLITGCTVPSGSNSKIGDNRDMSSSSIPPIDAAAPTITETATFALG